MREIGWTEDSEDHIARHQVEPGEVESVVYSRPRWSRPGRRSTELVYGTTEAGRFLLVVLAPGPDGRSVVVTARDRTSQNVGCSNDERASAPEEAYTMDTTASEHDLAALRAHYDTTSTANELADEAAGRWETDVDPDPMITTSLRLPKSVLDQVRERAAAAGLKPTALIRAWIETAVVRPPAAPSVPPQHTGNALEKRAADINDRLTRLEHAVFDHAASDRDAH